MRYQKSFFIISILIFVSCSIGSSEDELISTNDTSTSTTVTTLEKTPEPSTTTTSLLEEVCTGDNNKNIDFTKVRNIQIFLNKYGFNAGDEDGYLGSQTTNAIRRFQTYAGLYPDGDAGPQTIEIMQNWTGCETKSTQIQNTTTTTVATPDSTTTTTTIPSSTTTTVVSTEINTNTDDIGYFASVSLSTNNIQTILKGINNSNSICGTPYYNSLESNVLNYFDNGNVESLNYSSNTLKESSAVTEITSITNEEIVIQIQGNGDENFNFFFIEPYSSKIISIIPDNLSISSGLTEATFLKQNLKDGYWFYSFAENASGNIVKSSGLREFSINPSRSQFRDSQTTVEKIFFTKNGNSITYGENLSISDEIEISFITDQVLSTRENTTEVINSNASTISLTNDSQADVGELLLIDNELLYVESKNGTQYTVTRGYLNTVFKEHNVGTSVKKVNQISESSIISDFAYIIIRNEDGLRFQVPLDGELYVNKFNLKGCPNSRYSFEEIKTFGWREQGSSIVSTSTNKNLVNSIFNKEFVVTDSSINYQPPSLKGSDSSSGEFLNDGPRNLTVSSGNIVNFSFNGLTQGSTEIRFVKLNFQMIPTDSSKLTKNKSVIQKVNNRDFNFTINFQGFTNDESHSTNIWEQGYKYIFQGIEVYDELSKTIFLNNGNIKYDSNKADSQHSAYYLDQFSFLVP